jgi:alanine racemase
MGVVVKADAYGHGIVACSRAAVAAGAQMLIVNDVDEATLLRSAGITDDIYICGPLAPQQARAAVDTGAALVVSEQKSVDALSQAAVAAQRTIQLHLKIETGTHRQGVLPEAAADLARMIQVRPGIQLAGITTHLADLEDGMDDLFARQQLERFEVAHCSLKSAGFNQLLRHAASSAAALMMPASQLDMVRAGLITYGLCPSDTLARRINAQIELRPVLSWRARVFPGAEVGVGESIGYGRTYRVGAGEPRRHAVLNVGYHEGFDRRRSNRGYVLVGGLRAPVRGRVCMNMSMVEPAANTTIGAVATIIGRDGTDSISADLVAAWTSTINYEVVSRIHPRIPRIMR